MITALALVFAAGKLATWGEIVESPFEMVGASLILADLNFDCQFDALF
jgi:hypothetical protein